MNILSFVFVIYMLSLDFILSVTKQERVRQIILLTSSYVFYSYADYHFLGILLMQTIIAYNTAKFIDKERKKGKSPRLVFMIGLICCIGILSTWKYVAYYIPYSETNRGGGIR